MSDMSDYYEELTAESDRLKVVLAIKERELRAARKVVEQAYWRLAYDWQSHLLDVPKTPFRVTMSSFEPGVYPMMGRSDQQLYDALAAYEKALRGEGKE